MNATKYQELRDKIEREYRANLAALDRIQSLDEDLESDNDQQVNPPKDNRSSKSESADGDESTGKGVVIKAVSEILSNLPAEFTAREAASALDAEHPKSDFKEASVKQAIGRLVELGKVKIAAQGSGRSPNKYRRA